MKRISMIPMRDGDRSSIHLVEKAATFCQIHIQQVQSAFGENGEYSPVTRLLVLVSGIFLAWRSPRSADFISGGMAAGTRAAF